MSERKRDYDSTVARIAGNIASGLLSGAEATGQGAIHARERVAEVSVDIARRIVAEVKRTEPTP